MADTPPRKLWALTKAHISVILDEDVYRPDKNPGLPPGLGQASNKIYLNAISTREWMEQWCRDAFVLVAAKDENENKNLDTHFERLDALFATLATCNFQLQRHKKDRDAIVDGAYAVLQRLPRHPPELTFEYSGRSRSKTNSVGDSWPPEYFCALSSEGIEDITALKAYRWADLQVLSRPCTNVIRTALWLCMEMGNTFTIYNYADTIVKLLDTVTDLQKTSTTEPEARAWFILTLCFDAAICLRNGEIPSVIPPRETLLRADLSSVTQDFRTLFEIYECQFGSRESRYNQSYMSIKGARAVCLETIDNKHIWYRPISSENMAVSHVWSHGQGGQPETGFNIYLYRRYTELARPCILTDNNLRDEAIGQINNNFINSKLNVRAWTLLEGIRGRVNLHILCKDNRVISLKTVLTDILSKSYLSLILPCLAIQHYTQTRDNTNLVKTEQATCLLNHRHPTKDRDIIIIWSLVCGSGKVVKTAEAFWRSMVGGLLATGFLISSSPRIKGVRGLSWAPERPNLVPPTSDFASISNSDGATGTSIQYPAFNGHNSVEGTITPDGFQAEWLVCRVQRRGPFHSAGLSGAEGYYQIYNEGANDKIDFKSLLYLRSVVAPLFKRYSWVALLLPACSSRGGKVIDPPARPFRYQGEDYSDDARAGEGWEWQGVFEWDGRFRLPEFSCANILLV
ncbi:HET domain protein [Aspergillus undulatus]|uniref:HET domain protein n=1 Tax=Aspergillus undulatus TaxID=1810928 RepID=UPI003CCE4184